MNPWFTEFYRCYPPLNMPDEFAPNPNTWGKRSRNHIGDHTEPKAKMSKHRKFIQKMARV